ncbi:MAG TPA: hypothetical protein VNU21_06805 [Usitatibacter sp.]|nr:hypothetical protein [Usitatibacter sp.]
MGRIVAFGAHSLDGGEEAGERSRAGDADGAIFVLREHDLLSRLDAKFRRDADGGIAAIAESTRGHW